MLPRSDMSPYPYTCRLGNDRCKARYFCRLSAYYWTGTV
jgi:hypothetical protein